MSRNIMPKASVTITEEERSFRNVQSGKLLFTCWKSRSCALLIRNGRLIEAAFSSGEAGKVGAVYIGKVKNVAHNIDACFVEIARGETCFLAMKNAGQPLLLNRSYDGRILEGDELLVQVIKDAQKAKRASVTAQFSLDNPYFVLSFGTVKTGFSTKLDGKQKNAIKQILRNAGILDADARDCLRRDIAGLMPSDEEDRLKMQDFLPPTGLIVRTKAGEAESAEVLLEAFYELLGQYLKLIRNARFRSCFTCLKKAESEIVSLADRLTAENKTETEIVTDRKSVYEQLTAAGFSVRLYEDTFLSLSSLYGIDSKMKTAFESRVWLKSGAYLVIESTEALTVVDVNSGKCEAGKDPQEVWHRINMEAAEEVACQLRLRNLSGIIIVDFINMRSPYKEQELMQYLKELTAKDRIPTQIVDMTRLGLIEITRKKINKPLKEQFQNCSAADGEESCKYGVH